jgi:hypothetical protein
MSQKKVYTPPKLVVYGNIRQLTKSRSMAGSNKDGGPNNIKT